MKDPEKGGELAKQHSWKSAMERTMGNKVHDGFANGPVYFPANSWIHSCNDNPESRIIFRNHTYLPAQTPPGIKDLRREDLLSRRGDGKEERRLHEMIYNYAPYNDLGNPDKDDDLFRPVLAGSKRPYPRRCRTGRPPMKSGIAALPHPYTALVFVSLSDKQYVW
ncbi:probable lipoxygenase 6 [Chenopodium quinoa]|uniref:probable lipoxygenase 6 n=1 Tax=Chenopodium quinoa TaxID=63459 RepID=UPI000B78DF81|nr:probable lipoxygenase 6 [Chenopodium quinoa]